jgi:hypothetical protein
MEVLSQLRDSLDYINQHLSEDDILERGLSDWRAFLGPWRKRSYNDLLSFAYIKGVGGVGLDWLIEAEKELAERGEKTFHAIMSTMAILESKKAIQQAGAISKITNLAFFFIPFTFSATLMSMELVVSFYFFLLCSTLSSATSLYVTGADLSVPNP